MSDSTPTESFEQAEDTAGHSRLTDPGEIAVEGGRSQLPVPGDEDDTQGHRAAITLQATGDGVEQDDTDGPRNAQI